MVAYCFLGYVLVTARLVAYRFLGYVLVLLQRCTRIYVQQYGAVFFFQAEDGIRDAQESRGLGDVYKRQGWRGTST